uniref:GRF-type domain-containing protein n=1 Tax=Panagrellus redivivus TaxID=6233 RepID=A0A7E4W0K3_PANRE
MAGSKRRHKLRRRLRRRTSSSSGPPEVPSVDDDELLSPKAARDEIRTILLETIDDAAKEIPRRPPSQRSERPRQSETRRKKKPPPSEGVDQDVCAECGKTTLPFPVSHGVFPKTEPLYCRDRYFVCNGKNMFTREIFSAQGRPIPADRARLNELRGLPPPANIPKVSTSSSNPNRVNTVVVQNVKDDAKGMTLQLRVKLLKPGGEAKHIDLAIEMPDFEPSCVRVGQKTAFLE